jgi:glycerol kinase
MFYDDFLLAIDQGTSSTRVILFNLEGEVLSISQKESTLSYPKLGWVEQNAEAILEDALFCCKESIRSKNKNPLAIGITNQRETTIIWDKKTGKPIYNAIVWQDTRTAEFCDNLIKEGNETWVRDRTGLLLDPYFSATKIVWLLDNIEGARKKAEAGDLLFGTVDCFLLWHLTCGEIHATDRTNASRTMLMDIHTGNWDQELLNLFNIPSEILPEIKNNVDDFGEIGQPLFDTQVPIKALIGDQQAALVGQGCFGRGMVKSTYGTGCFALMNIGENAAISRHRLITTVAYSIDEKITYALEGSIFIAGAAIQWIKDGLSLLSNYEDSEKIAEEISSTQGVYFIPALTGLGAPYWRSDVRGSIVGLSRETKSDHIIRASLEAQAYQTRDLIDVMCQDADLSIDQIRIDGGLAKNKFVCQFLADILQRRIHVPRSNEATAWGAACLAGLGVGAFGDLNEIGSTWQPSKCYESKMASEKSDELYEGWRVAISKLLYKG